MARRKKSFQKNYAREASSFILIALGIILMLAILSYDRADDPNLKIDNNSIQIKNFIGPAGAAIAAPLMNYTLGYPILFLPIIIILVGLQLFRGNRLIQYLRPVVLLTVWAVFISIVLALPEAFETYGKIREYYPSGVVGGTAASYLLFYFGKIGTIQIMATRLLVLTVVTLRLDLVMILDYIINNFKKVQKQFRRRYQDWLAERNRRKKQAFLKRQKYKIEPEIINNKQIEIKTGDQAK